MRSVCKCLCPPSPVHPPITPIPTHPHWVLLREGSLAGDQESNVNEVVLPYPHHVHRIVESSTVIYNKNTAKDLCFVASCLSLSLIFGVVISATF